MSDLMDSGYRVLQTAFGFRGGMLTDPDTHCPALDVGQGVGFTIVHVGRGEVNDSGTTQQLLQDTLYNRRQ